MKIRYSIDVIMDLHPEDVDFSDDPQKLTDYAASQTYAVKDALYAYGASASGFVLDGPESWVVEDDDGEIIVEHN